MCRGPETFWILSDDRKCLRCSSFEFVTLSCITPNVCNLECLDTQFALLICVLVAWLTNRYLYPKAPRRPPVRLSRHIL